MLPFLYKSQQLAVLREVRVNQWRAVSFLLFFAIFRQLRDVFFLSKNITSFQQNWSYLLHFDVVIIYVLKNAHLIPIASRIINIISFNPSAYLFSYQRWKGRGRNPVYENFAEDAFNMLSVLIFSFTDKKKTFLLIFIFNHWR